MDIYDETGGSTGVLNARVRNIDKLTAAEIHFSRDVIRGENLKLDDRDLLSSREERRASNRTSSAMSKSKSQIAPSPTGAVTGDIVYPRSGMGKHTARDPYLVVGQTGRKIQIKKILHSNPSDQKSTKVSPATQFVEDKFLYKPSVPPIKITHAPNEDSEDHSRHHPHPPPPWIPTVATENDEDDYILEN